MTGLLALIRDHPDALEADLSRYHNGLDLRDYWRRGRDGRRLLTLRQIAARVRWLPAEGAVARATGGPGWTRADYLLADLFHTQTGKPHPARPTAPAAKPRDDPQRRRKRADALRRKRAREEAIREGRLT